MVRTDAIVLGAGVVGTSAALHLARSGLSVALIERGAPGEGTSYGNAGIIETNTYFPYPIPPLDRLLAIAFKRATEADYHLSALPRLIPWLFAYAAHSRPAGKLEFAHTMRPLFSRATTEHEILLKESGAERHLRKNGWLKIFRSRAGLESARADLDAIAQGGLAFDILDCDQSRALEPDLAPVFHAAVSWPSAASIDNPLAVTRAYLARFKALGGILLSGDARKLHRSGSYWRIDTDEGPVDAPAAVVALGPWAPDILAPLGIHVPLAAKRGYHLHFRPRGNSGLSRPVVDVEVGHAVAPMEQGLRLTTGAEFAGRDDPATPAQMARILPLARGLFPLGEQVEPQPWLGSRPCFPDSRPVIGPAPGQPGLWLDFGHAHWGLTLGPVSGRLLAEMMTGKTPFTDPAPYSIERFS